MCAVVLGALFLAFLGLHTPPAKKALAAAVAKWISSRLGGPVTLAQLDYQLWRGEASIASLRTIGRGVDATSGRIEVRFAPGTGLEVRAFDPRVQITLARSSGRASGEAERPWIAVLHMARIEIVHGAVDVVDSDGQPLLSLAGIDALMTRTPGGAAGDVRINAAASRSAKGPRIEGVNVDARVEIRSDSGLLVVPAAKLRSGGSAVDVAGELARTTPLALQLRFNGVVESALVAAAMPKQGFRIPGSPSIAVRGRLDNDRLIADALEAPLFDGIVTARGTTGLSDHAGEFTISARNLDVHEISTLWSSPAIASRADADLALRMSDWNPESLTGSGTISFRSQRSPGLPIAGATRVGWNGSALTWDAERLMIRELAVRLDGRLRSDGDISARYTADIPSVDRVAPLLHDLGIRMSSLPLAGSVSAAGTIEGRVPEVTLTARVAGTDVSWNALRAGVEGDVRVTRSGIEVVSLLARGAEVEARAEGLIPLQPRGQWKMAGEIQRIDLSGLLADRGIVMPANASGSFAISGARSSPVVRIERSTGTLAGGTVALSGSWHPQSGAIEGRVEAAQIDVPRLEPVAPALRAVDARLALTADISGSLTAPAGRAHVALTGTRLREMELADVALDLSSDGREVSVAGALGGRPILSGQGRVGGTWPLDLKVDLASLPAADLVRIIPLPAGAIADVSLAGQANLQLALRDPSAFEYQAEISQLGLRAAREWRAGPFSASGNRDHVLIRSLDLRSGDSRVNVDGGLGFTEQSGTMTINADAPLADFALLLPGVAAEGQAEVALRLTGSFASPIVDGRIALHDGSVQASRVKADQIQIEAIAEQSTLSIRNATGRIGGGEVRVTGALPLGLRSGDQSRQLDFTLRGIDLATFAVSAAQVAKLSVPVDLDGRITLSRLAMNAIEAHGALTRMTVNADTERVDLEAPVSWTFERGTLAHAPLRLRGPRSHATVSATLTSAGDQIRFAVASSGTVDLSVANPFLADAGVAGGTLTFDAGFTHTRAQWTIRGTANVADGRLVLRSPQLALTGLRAALRAEGNRVELVEATATMGDGKIVARGQAAITKSDVDLDVRVEADRVPLEHPEGLRTRSSGAILLSGTVAKPRITGDLVVHRAVYERELDRTAQALDRAGTRAAVRSSGAESLADRTELELTLRPEDGLRVATDTATLVIDGTVKAGGTLATPELDGSLSVREGGTVRVSRALVRLQGGRIELRSFPARPPEIEIQGVTQVTGVRIDVGLSGSLDDLRMNLSSSNRSDLSQGDLATLILTGRTTSEAAADSGAIVVEEVAAALGQALDRQLGGAVMIDVSRDESLIVEDTNPSQRLNIGVPINNRLYVIYSRSLDHEALRWIVDFKPGGDFRLRAIANDDASEAVEVSHRFGFDAWSRKYRQARAKEARLEIGDVVVTGAPSGTEAELRKQLKLKRGDTFDYFRSEAAAAKARQWLVKRGYLTASVEIRETSRDTDVGLAARINPGPRMTIEWRGYDPGRKEKKRLNAGWATFLPLQDTAERLARDVRHNLRARGYYNAVVTTEVDSRNGEARAVFDVRRGEKGNGVALVFDGNASITDATLAAVLPDRKSAAFFALLDGESAQKMATAIRFAYAREGFLQAEVGAPITQIESASGRLLVTIPVREGSRASVLALDVPPEVGTLDGAEAPAFELRPGDHFRLDAYNADRTRLRTWYRNQGFPDARVQGVVEPSTDGVVVRLRAEPGPRVRVADVRTSRDGHTRAGVIQHAVGMTEGDLARASDLDAARQRLTETRAFRSVDVRLQPVPGKEDVRDVVVDLSQRTDITTEYSLRYTSAGNGEVGGAPSESDAGLQVGGAVEFVNPFGWAARYRLYGLYGAERRLLGGRYESSTFFGHQWETQVFLFDDTDRVEDLDTLGEHVKGATFQQTKRWRAALDGRRLHDRLRVQWGYTYKWIRYRSLESGATFGGYRAGPILSLISDSRDSVTDPHRGLFWSVGTETALTPLGSDVNYIKTFGQLFFYTPLTPRITWAQSFRLGFVPGTNPLLLLESRFKAGGASSVRGFDENMLGPTTAAGEPYGGQAITIINQELRFPLFKKVFGGLFYDAGNVFLLARDLDLGSLRQSAGAGLRLMFPFGPVRLDWSAVIDPREGEKRSRLHFSIGHVF